MRERPILFNDAMVRAILDGRKTQTRRPVQPQPTAYVAGPNRHAAKREHPYFDAYCSVKKNEANPRGMSDHWCWWTPDERQGPDWIQCPFGAPGDRLWVRECWNKEGGAVSYRADGDWIADYNATKPARPIRWRPSIHIPRWASRLTLLVTDVRVERLQDIVESEAMCEGFTSETHHSATHAFCDAWPYDGTAHEWAANPWVWVVSFERLDGAKGGE